MEQDIIDELSKPEKTGFHQDVLREVLALVDESRAVVEPYYPMWTKYDRLFRAYSPVDKQDKKAATKNEPKKTIVPVTLTLTATFQAFAFAVLTQRPDFYELIGTGLEDQNDGRFLAQGLLQRDLQESNFFGKVLPDGLLGFVKHGACVLKHRWCEKTAQRRTTQEKRTLQSTFRGLFGGNSTELVESVESYIKFQGNKVENIPLYRFFPDPTVPFDQFQEGRFCASESEMGYMELKRREGRGEVVGIDEVKTLNPERLYGRERVYSARTQIVNQGRQRSVMEVKDHPLLITEVQWTTIPSKTTLSNGKLLGAEDYPVKFLVEIANDDRIINLRRLNYLHDEYTYDVASFFTDDRSYIPFGVPEIVEDLQAIITWLINSRITSVRQMIQNRLIVDPSGVNMSDIRERRPVIRLIETASDGDVRKYINQLDLKDVTQAHLTDVEYLKNLVYEVTGISQNMMGQYSSGRRSAREAQSVNVNATNRAMLYVRRFWEGCAYPLGQKMLQNLRDGLTVEQYVKRVGLQNAQNPGALQLFAVTRDHIAGDYDFVPFDGTLPSERAYIAESLRGMIETLVSNPQLIQMYGIDLWKLFKEWAVMRGIRYPEQFQMSASEQALMLQLTQQNGEGQPGQSPGRGNQGVDGVPSAAQPTGQDSGGPSAGFLPLAQG